MAANAPPYYQGTNAPPPSHFASEDEEYDLATSAVASPHMQPLSLYTGYIARQASAETPGTCHNHPSMNSEENHNLAELLEAATSAAAAGQAVEARNAVVEAMTAAQGRGKRKRAGSSPATEAPRSGNPKRRKMALPIQSAGNSSAIMSSTDPRLQDIEPEVPASGESLLNDVRAAGVHSAAALFRRSLEKTSRKYTRPPMSKLFMSLQLSPENFLQLQASAKSYMLDSAYPERQNCVGNRGKGDTDMVKLRLFNCVRDFLNEGVGEQYFGEHVEKPGENDAIEAARALGEDKAPHSEERLTWPRDGNKIISLVTPLMRRMVTNERQRMYAIETRKGRSKKKDKDGSVDAASPQVINISPTSPFDPLLRQSRPTSPSCATPVTPGPPTMMPRSAPQAAHFGPEQIQGTATQEPTKPNLGHINLFLVQANIKLLDKRITPEPPLDHLISTPWTQLLHKVTELMHNASHRLASQSTAGMQSPFPSLSSQVPLKFLDTLLNDPLTNRIIT
jgi:hypothetical protein